MRVATLDDDQDQLELTKYTLKAIGHECHTFTTGKDLTRHLSRDNFDLIILDWNLPDTRGPEVVKWIRSYVKERVPILFLTVRDDEAAIVEGLSAGADDFMVKPMRIGELTARVTALLRRVYPKQIGGEKKWGIYYFNAAACTVEIDGEPVLLKQKEFELALFLFRNMGRLLSRQCLLESLWTAANPAGTALMSRSLDTHISRVRNLLRLRPENGYKLSSIYGQGYRLETLVEESRELS